MTTTTTPTWFITGASSGFGMAFARYALDRGYNVVATARLVGKLEALAASTPDRVLVHKLDVTVPADAEAAIAAVVRRFGRIDVLINNAGYGTMGAVEDARRRVPCADGDQLLRCAVGHQGSPAVSPAAARRRHRQHVEQRRADVVSWRRFVLRVKVRTEGMSEALAQELAPFGIKVLIVEPGFRTGFGGDALKYMPMMEEYRDIVGVMRDFTLKMDGTQEGDPYKAAAAIERALAAETTPLRLQLGADGVASVRAHAEQLLQDLASGIVVVETRLDPVVA